MRKWIYTMVEKAAPGDRTSHLYDYFITAVSIFSLIPLMFKGTNQILFHINNISVYILFADYVLRFMTHDYRRGEVGNPWAFVRYPFSVWAICDLLAILPTLGLLDAPFRLLRMFRVVKILHYSKSFVYVSNVFKKQRKTLLSVLIIALAYIYVSALAMFNYEPDTFDDFFEALYWATTALTTVGYGDVYPVSNLGRLISMISSLFGIAVIALPAGILTAGFMDELNQDEEEKERAADVLQEVGHAVAAQDDSRQLIMEAARARAVAVGEALEAGSTVDEIRAESVDGTLTAHDKGGARHE